MNVITTDIPEVLIIEPKLFGDQRGFFLETYQFARYADSGLSGLSCRTTSRVRATACCEDCICSIR